MEVVCTLRATNKEKKHRSTNPIKSSSVPEHCVNKLNAINFIINLLTEEEEFHSTLHIDQKGKGPTHSQYKSFVNLPTIYFAHSFLVVMN